MTYEGLWLFRGTEMESEGQGRFPIHLHSFVPSVFFLHKHILLYYTNSFKMISSLYYKTKIDIFKLVSES